MTESVISNSTATVTGGGGIRNGGNGVLLVQRSTIHNNQTVDQGGGISNISTTGSVTILNSTISQNSAQLDGGGIFSFGGSTTTIVNGTIAKNVADVDNNGNGQGGGLRAQGTERVVNTLIAGNLIGGSLINGNVTGDIEIDSNNLSGVSAFLLIDSNLVNNGGPTPTHRLLFNVFDPTDNDAYDAGDNALATTNGQIGGTPLTTDQRGLLRIVDGNGDGTATVDVGAYEFIPSNDPLLDNVAPSVTFFEGDVKAEPQLIDTDVTLIDADSPNFNGGRLFISYDIDGDGNGVFGLTEDNLGIRNQGSGLGEIDVVGNEVRFGGQVIGDIGNDGQNGKPLVIFFNALATPAAVEALLENLTYGNPSETPAAQRTIAMLLQDGAGGETTQLVEINVTPQNNENVTVTGTANDDQISIIFDGTNIVINDGTTQQLINPADLTGQTIFVNSGDGNDNVTVDVALSTFGIMVVYDGQGQAGVPGDSLTITGTGATTLEYIFADANSGSVRVDGSATDFITYTGLEPIVDDTDADNVILTFSALADGIDVTDAGGMIQVVSNNGTAEMVTFASPASSLTFNLVRGAMC